MDETQIAKALFLLKRANIAVDKTMNVATAQYNMTSAQMEVLIAVAKKEGIEHRELLEWIGVASPTLTNLIDKLVNQGFLERRISPEDARVKQLFLTVESRTFWEELLATCDQYMAMLVKNFSTDEIAQLDSLLGKIVLNADSANEWFFNE